MSKTDYNKVPKDIEGQIALLKERNLIIPDESKAAKVLANISYNRLSNYWYPLLADPKDDEIFKDGANFDNIFHIYQFDSELRVLVFYAIEQIEIAFRTQLIYHLSIEHNSGFWYENAKLFKSYPSYVSFLDKICTSVQNTKQIFIQKYKTKYNQYLPPSWKSFELISFTALFGVYKNLKETDSKLPINRHFGLHHNVFISWMETLVYIRNICAHHSRLWNIVLTKTPVWVRSPRKDWVSRWENEETETNDKRLKMYAVCCLLTYLLDHINPYHKFRPRLTTLLQQFEDDVDISQMGFPDNWKDEPLWKTED